jgi:putative copper export protein
MLGLIVRASGLTCLVLAIGCVAFTMIARSVLGDTEKSGALFQRVARCGMYVSIALVPIAFARLYWQLDAMRFPGDPLLTSLEAVLTTTTWGKAWTTQLVFVLVTVGAFVGAIRARTVIAFAALALTVVAATFSLSGHAAAVEKLRTAVIGADTLHIITAGSWIGTIAMIVFFWRRLRDTGGLGAVINAFSPVALACAAMLTMSGLIGSLAHVTAVSQIWTTAYGRTLAVKVLLVAAVIAAGWFNWKRHSVRITNDDGMSLRTGAIRELVAAAAVVIVTAMLIVTPPPNE